jgi:dTDP-4-amino-4,6-dideoxygalactose transaminase
MKPFNSFNYDEYKAISKFSASVLYENVPLSGYLAGKERGGLQVCALEDAWAKTFKVKHAIACNSATSGLLAASFAVGLGAGDQFVCPAMTMSATCAAPMFTGATPFFCDVSDEDFGLVPEPMPDNTKAIFTTNLFGHPSRLARNQWSTIGPDPVYLIEDNSQSPFAWANDRYAGTMGTIGVFSLNVHKPLQCGEGGMIVTDDDDLAERMRAFINHGEHSGPDIGLNLRMPEVCAAIALMQLHRGEEIIQGRIDKATAILAAIGDIPGIRPPITGLRCRHVYYTIPFLIDHRRAEFCAALRAEGVPIVEGYVDPLYRMPAFARFARPCPVAEDLHDRRLFYFENCAWALNGDDVVMVADAFKRAAEKWL